MSTVDERIPRGFGSESPSPLLSALLALQAELPPLPKDKKNPHFGSKFTGLETIVEKVGPLLAKHRLVWITKPDRDELGPYLEYRLIHLDSGEAEVGRMPLLLGKDDMQGLGSALTYARRYALASVLNLVSDEDDDGDSAARARAGGYGRNSIAGAAAAAAANDLTKVGRGLSDPALAAAYKQAGMEPPASLFGGLARIPPDKFDAMYAALQAAHHAR